MTEIHQKKEVKSENAINPIVAGIVGVVAGGVAVATTMVMSDKKNQKKVKDALVDAKEKVTGYINTVKIESQPIIEKSVQKIEEVANDTKRKLENKK